MKQLLLDVLAAPAPTLENYVPGPNTEALETLRTLPPGRAVYLWGPAGCGRTHLLRALSAHAGAVYLDSRSPVSAYKRAAQPEDAEARPGLVAIDDLHLLDEARLGAVFTLYNRWRELTATDMALSLIVAGELAPGQLEIREDLRTRLGWDLVFRLDVLSDAEKTDALIRQAASRGLNLAPEVVNWILTHYERDMRQLTALLDALDHYSLAAKRPITLPLLRAMLAEQHQSSSPQPHSSLS
ncbi:DnaA regulatory inactivator Hda [Pigmentiphaga sp.]|jgi:DnaA regulatory inactivator Hda|uniref:DnaA regulatory inactivator Hda n=1 Tax=Pigmentiphaga sp. TaxID=1977564 RepID=UPI0025D38FCC|nr:DnaA regulatory inactivator Hda [Pigmentiphaga sp.]MBX6317191.1 DnaA regulatory inactivator Hda [Pigmentiphaga sp.]